MGPGKPEGFSLWKFLFLITGHRRLLFLRLLLFSFTQFRLCSKEQSAKCQSPDRNEENGFRCGLHVEAPLLTGPDHSMLYECGL